jgi:hypothetical protein
VMWQTTPIGIYPANAAGAIYTPPFVGGVATTVSAKLAQTVSVLDFGADPTGATDSTAAIQAALNAGQKAVFVPPGNYKYSALVMPTTFGFVFYGVGTASVLTQTGTGITWPSTGTSPPGYYEGYVRDLSFVALGSANGHTIDTQYAGGLTLLNLYFGNMPVGFDSIHVRGNTASTGDKYSHDVVIENLQIYTNTAGRAGIYYDTTASDTSFTDFRMNGNFVAQYCIFAANGAQSINGSNSHPYNALTNIMNIAGGAATALGMTFTNVIFDNAQSGDNVVLNNCNAPVLTGCWWEVISSGHNGLTLNNCRASCITGCRFDSPGGALFCVTETGTTDYTQIISGDSPTIVNFSNPPINFIGAHSVCKNFVAFNAFGEQIAFTGSTIGTVAAGVTTFLGCNAQQATENDTAFMVSLISGMNVLRADIAFTIAPGVGQSYTFTLRGNGATLTAASGSANPAVVTGAGIFNASIIVAQGAGAFVSQFNTVSIQLVTSAGASSARYRYAIECIG